MSIVVLKSLWGRWEVNNPFASVIRLYFATLYYQKSKSVFFFSLPFCYFFAVVLSACAGVYHLFIIVYACMQIKVSSSFLHNDNSWLLFFFVTTPQTNQNFWIFRRKNQHKFEFKWELDSIDRVKLFFPGPKTSSWYKFTFFFCQIVSHY